MILSNTVEDIAYCIEESKKYRSALRENVKLELKRDVDGEGPFEEGDENLKSLFWFRQYYNPSFRTETSDISWQELLDLEESFFSDGFIVDNEFFERMGYPAKTTGLNYSPLLHKKVKAALEIIRETAPELLDKINEVIKGYACVSTVDQTRAFSDPKFYGLIFFETTFFEKETDFEIAANIIHECGHQELFVETGRDSLIPEEFAKEVFSPIRNSYRPSIGVYHAMFVHARVISWCKRIIESGSIRYSDIAKEYLETEQAQLKGSLESLKDIKFSERGQEIYDRIANGGFLSESTISA